VLEKVTDDRLQSGVTTAPNQWEMQVERLGEDTVQVRLSGRWGMKDRLPPAADLARRIESEGWARRLSFDTRGVTAWDTGLLAFASKLCEWSAGTGIETDVTGLPEGIQRLLRLASAVPSRQTGREKTRQPWLARVGEAVLAAWADAIEILTFVGGACVALLALLRGKARFQASELAVHIQACGASALPIVTLISFLVGLILAFVGAVQLRQFGAQIYVADLVGIAMAQQMGAMMTAIVMAGRSGAAFAAQLGTMQVNEEVDALTTMGLSAMEFLVLPRVMALVLMMPLLTVYADLLGILGGALVGIAMLGLTPTQYLNETISALSLTDFVMGLIDCVVFGGLVALAGCLRGMQSGRSSAAVGLAVTSAVVTGIVCIIFSDAVLTVVYHVLGL
jgi:phospholipid/cholesterol/gamma-HCH transport system permease protein